MLMSATAVNTKVAEAVTALEADDFGTALQKLRGARALLLAMPDSRSLAGTELTWDRKAIDAAIKDLERQLRAATGIQDTLINYARPSC